MTTEAGVGGGVPRFDVVLRGYDRRQVDEHVARLQRAIVRMRSDLDVVRSQPLSAVGRPTPNARPGMPPDGGPEAQAIVQKAEEEAADIRNRARSAARAEEERVKAQLADLTRQRDALLAEISRLRGQRDSMQREAPVVAPTSRMSSPSDAPPGSAGTPPRTRDGGQGGSTPGMDSPGGRPAAPRPRPGAGAQAPAAARGGAPVPGAPGPGGKGGPGGQGGPGRPGQSPAGPNRPPQVADPTVAARPNTAPKAPGAPGGGPKSSPHHQVPGAGGAQQPPSRPVEPGRPGAGGPGGPPGAKGGAAHRLPSGGFPAVDKAPSSMRPRGEPEPDIGDLFRPRPGAQPGAPGGQQRQGANPPQDPTAMVRAAEPRGSAPIRPADPTRSVDPPPKTGQHGPGRGAGSGPGGPGQPKKGQPNGNQPNGGNQPKGGPGGKGRPGGPDATVLASARPGEQQQKPADPKQGRQDADKGERGPKGGPNGPGRAGRSPSTSRSG